MKSSEHLKLKLHPNLADADGFYDELLRVHENLDDEQSASLNARLILILCNHIGDRQVLQQALATAAQAVQEI